MRNETLAHQLFTLPAACDPTRPGQRACLRRWLAQHCPQTVPFVATRAAVTWLEQQRRIRGRRASLVDTQTVFIAANLKNCVELLKRFWVPALLDLVDKLGRGRVFVSIYESGSNDETPTELVRLGQQLSERGVKVTCRLPPPTAAAAAAAVCMPTVL